jgi:cellobiose transport system substrate-binding protein
MEGIVRRRLGLGTVAALAVLLAACGGGGSDSSSSSSTPAATAPAGSTAAAAAATTASTEPVTLTIDTFGDFGYKELIANYVKLHPNVTVKEIQQEYNQHHQQLAQHLAAGSGAADIVAIDEGFIVQFRSTPDKFVNLLDLGAADLKDRWLPWKWAASMSADGKTQIGLGTDVGGLAMCYRKDLLAAAGLPSDRDELSAMWPDWNAFIATGQKFQEAGTGVKWVDSATNMLNPIIAQQPVGYFDTSDQLVFDTNPGVKTAWDSTMDMISKKESAGLAAFSPEWNAGFKKGKFATVACPAWMMGYIKDQAPDTSGKWDVAAIPGGGGNWGGSFLAIPKESKNPQAAYDLAAYLTAPEQELQIFKDTGNLPSLPALYTDPALTGFTNPFFSDAPVGTIFSDTAAALQPQYLGTKNGPVRQAVENVVREVENGSLSADDGWEKASKAAAKAAG